VSRDALLPLPISSIRRSVCSLLGELDALPQLRNENQKRLVSLPDNKRPARKTLLEEMRASGEL